LQFFLFFGSEIHLFPEVLLETPISLFNTAYGAEELPLAYGHEGSGCLLCIGRTFGAIERYGSAVEVLVTEDKVVVDSLFGDIQGGEYECAGKAYIVFPELVAEYDRIVVFVEQYVEHLPVKRFARIDKRNE